MKMLDTKDPQSSVTLGSARCPFTTLVQSNPDNSAHLSSLSRQRRLFMPFLQQLRNHCSFADHESGCPR